jgi:UDP-N-acetylmuramate--alanine ligase
VKTRKETFGTITDCDWNAEGLEAIHGRFHFSIRYHDEFVGAFQLRIPGVHNVKNALAATAVAWWAGVDKDVIRDALGTFSGADRRFEIVYDAKDFIIVDDYAHHPTEIQVTLKAARDFFGPKRVWVVFQPHQHSRTRFLLEDFAKSFALADKILVPEIYFVRDSAEEREAISSLDLVNSISNLVGGEACYMPSFEEIVDHLDDNLMPGDALITLGAGNVNRVAYEVAAMIANGSFTMV